MSSPEVEPLHGTTSTLALPYPGPSDPADVPADILALVNRIEFLYGHASGFASLDSGGKIPSAQLPSGLGAAAFSDTIAGLGTPAAGQWGIIRLRPTTYAAGAQALPAGTINGGMFTDFPLSGIVSTPNGDVTYTGRTGDTQLTGCTGGTGTLAANAVIQLKSGVLPRSGAFDYELVIYDAVVGKWVGMPHALRGHQGAPGVSGLGLPGSGAYTEVTPTGASFVEIVEATVPWRPYDAAGLKPQIRIPTFDLRRATNSTVGSAQPSFRSCAEGATAFAAIGNDANSESGYGTWDTNHRVRLGTPWASIPAYTLADIFAAGARWHMASGSTGDAGNYVGHLQVRWVG